MEITATAAANSSSVLNGVSRSKSDTIEGNLLFFHFYCSRVPINQLILVTNDGAQPEILNKRALAIVSRVRDKLTGRDFPYETEGTLSIQRQVELLVQQATSHENLCQCYIGW